MKLIRVLFIAVIFILSYFYFPQFWQDRPYLLLLILGLLSAAVVLLEYITSKANMVYLISFIIAFFTAALFSLIIGQINSLLNLDVTPHLLAAFSFLIFFYFCFSAAFKLTQSKFITSSKRTSSELIAVDTSAIIDGRIADLCATRFLSTRFLIPKFVLKELQGIADSQDPLKRTRGRRGLDILNKMRKAKIEVIIDEHDFPEIKEVDTKLIQLAKLYNISILTTDYNLNKVAELQGVVVLNINDLANALKPVFLPGESMKIRVVKEGKEHKQGVGYLDDGTMVVVEEGKRLMGNMVNVVVTSVLQTSAGRIIFTKKANH